MKRRLRADLVPGASLTGQQGVNLIASVVAEMGYLWTPTTGHSDAGIDGFNTAKTQERLFNADL